MTTTDAPLDPVTVRWTEALFHVATRAGALDEIQRDTERLSEEVASPSVASFLFGAGAGHGARVDKMQPLLEQLHPLTANFVRLLFDRRRQEVLVDLAEAFRRRVLETNGVVEGVVESPRPLDDSELDSLASTLGVRLGKTVRLAQRSNPELVAGVRVYVGARMLDSSVQGRMAGLRRRMLEASLPAAS